MALMFLPPTAYVRPMAVNPRHPGYSLFKHYRPIEVGTNVWLLPGGVVTTNEPDPNAEIVRVFHGGHQHLVDDVEAAALTAAGYTLVEV